MIKTIVLFMFAILFLLLFMALYGCDFQENSLVKDQAVTFEQEISYRQRKEIELENKLKKITLAYSHLKLIMIRK